MHWHPVVERNTKDQFKEEGVFTKERSYSGVSKITRLQIDIKFYITYIHDYSKSANTLDKKEWRKRFALAQGVVSCTELLALVVPFAA